MRTFTAGQWKCRVNFTRDLPGQIKCFFSNLLELGYVTWESPWAWVSGFHLPLQSGPPPRRGMRQWRRAWGRPSPAPPYKLELAPLYQSHPPAPPRKACSRGDDGDPAAAALPTMSSSPRVTRRWPQSAASPANGEREGWVWPGLAVGVTCGGKCAVAREAAASTPGQRTHQSDDARPRSETSQWLSQPTTKITTVPIQATIRRRTHPPPPQHTRSC